MSRLIWKDVPEITVGGMRDYRKRWLLFFNEKTQTPCVSWVDHYGSPGLDIRPSKGWTKFAEIEEQR